MQQSIACYLLFILFNGVHEFSHALFAYLFGDSTAKSYGRLTLNPLAHIDLIGTVIIPLTMIMIPNNIAIIGWGKPVPVDIRNFKHRALGDICTSLAGPLSNIAVAILLSIIGCLPWLSRNPMLGGLFGFAIIINISMAIFNLIPLPPLDGSHLLKYLVNMSEEAFIMISRWSYIIMLILINLPQSHAILLKAIYYTFWGIVYMGGKITGSTGDILFYFMK
jgi:Zn-dependent protease